MGVLTKSDLAKSEHVRDVVINQESNEVQFKYNWTAVINRNKTEENSNPPMTIEEKIKLTDEHFANDEVFDDVPKKYLGTTNLRENLSGILINLMRQALDPIL